MAEGHTERIKEIYFLWEKKKEGGVKAAPTFCCLGETADLEETQGAHEDEDVGMGPVEFSCSGVDAQLEVRALAVPSLNKWLNVRRKFCARQIQQVAVDMRMGITVER